MNKLWVVYVLLLFVIVFVISELLLSDKDSVSTDTTEQAEVIERFYAECPYCGSHYLVSAEEYYNGQH